ncbi:MAG TPA: pirin family protein, partial [Planctomycetaceae bacterium]|nr:pirin family protein [Planctomycetaceae bacterium]
RRLMMKTVRRGSDRGHLNHGWLDTYHTFSFGDYYDPAHTTFRSLRVMNEDRVDPGQGFGMHGHRDMEILTWVLDGELAHRDSLGHEEVLRPGELQRMSAGTGIRHSEFNPSPTTPVHLYQIWLLPDRNGHEPRYGQTAFPRDGRQGRWQLLASPDGRDGSLTIHADSTVSVAELAAGQSLTVALAPSRRGWLQVLRGEVEINGHELVAGDGAGVTEVTDIALTGTAPSEVLWFDLD